MEVANHSASIWTGRCDDLRVYDAVDTANPMLALQYVWQGISLTLQCYRRGIDAKVKQAGGKLGTTPALAVLPELYKELNFAHLSVTDLAVVVGLAVLWTFARHFLIDYVFKPYSKKIRVTEQNHEKFGEAAWKTTVYSVIWSYAVYVNFFCGYDFFTRPLSMWRDCTPGGPVPFDVCVFYAIEVSYYLHSTYATIYMDAWRKDSIVMLAHHAVVLWLLSFSYMFSVYQICVTAFVCTDFGDLILEAGKVLIYIRQRKDCCCARFLQFLCDAAAVLFAVQWAVLRLYFHVTKIWTAVTTGVWFSMKVLPAPILIVFIFFVSITYFFYVYWFAYILLFIVRLFGRQSKVEDDPREAKAVKTKKAIDFEKEE